MMKHGAQNRSVDERTDRHCAQNAGATRRGIAIMLVMISVAAATIMVGAYLASRRTAPQVSTNVLRGSAARSSAETGLSIAQAILECQDADFRNSMVNGLLLSESVGDANVSVTLTDLDGNPVTPSTQYFIVKATGVIDGMEQVAQAYAWVAPDNEAPLPTFSDFALFGTQSIEVTDGMVTRWTQSPNATWGAPVWVGTNAITSSSVVVNGAAHLIDATLQVNGNVGGSALSDTSTDGNRIRVRSLAGGTNLPVKAPPTPDTSMCTPSPTPVVDINNSTVLSNDSWILDSVTIRDTGKVRVSSSSRVTRHVTGNVVIKNGGVLIVETDHDFIIDGNLTIQNAAGINVNDGAHLRLWVGGNVTVDYGALGVSLARASTVTDPRRGLEIYKNPAECEIYQLPGATINKNWVFDNGSVIVASAYLPDSNVRVDHGTSYMGSILSKTARVINGSVIHYDPCLDRRGGYTNTAGPLYNSDGTLNTSLLATITDISDSSLASLKTTYDNLMSSLTSVLSGGSGDASPRDRKVKWSLNRLGIKTVRDRRDNTTTADDDSGVLSDG